MCNVFSERGDFMKINTNVYKQYIESGNSRKYPKGLYNGTSNKASSVKKDSFSLSSEASMFMECGKVIRNAVSEITSSAGEEKIELLKQRIASGNYNVSSEQIADSILERIV